MTNQNWKQFLAKGALHEQQTFDRDSLFQEKQRHVDTYIHYILNIDEKYDISIESDYKLMSRLFDRRYIAWHKTIAL